MWLFESVELILAVTLAVIVTLHNAWMFLLHPRLVVEAFTGADAWVTSETVREYQANLGCVQQQLNQLRKHND